MIIICNSLSLQQHLMEALHVPTEDTEYGWNQVDYDCARFNFEHPTKRKTAFLRYTTWPTIEQRISATIASPLANKYTQNDGRLVAKETFSTPVGQEVRFWNGVNNFDGYAKAYRNTLKVVFNLDPMSNYSQHLLINVITVYPVLVKYWSKSELGHSISLSISRFPNWQCTIVL